MGKTPKKFSFTEVLKDSSLHWLVIVNIAALVIVDLSYYDFYMLLWAYWFQSISIGIVNFFYMRSLKNFSTNNLKFNGRYVPPTKKTKKNISNFFLLHYNFFHLVYLIFLIATDTAFALDSVAILSAVIFGVYHFIDFNLDKKAYDPEERVNIGTVMFLPYLRIIPMHLIIVLGIIDTGIGFPVFVFFKIIADVGMQIFDNKKKYYVAKKKAVV